MSEERRRSCIRIATNLRELDQEIKELTQEIRAYNNAIRELKSKIIELEQRVRSLETPSIPLRRSPRSGRRQYPDDEGVQIQIEVQRSRKLGEARSKLRNLKIKLDRLESDLEKKTIKREDKRRNYYETERRYGANNCSDFPETVGYSRRGL